MNYEWLVRPLQIGDWVKLDSHFFKGFTGFIVKYDYCEDEYRVQLTKNAQGQSTSGVIWVNAEKVSPIDDEGPDENFLLGLIDTTLVLKQEKWFMELTSKLPQQNF
jgi:hypothetical protein